MREDPGTLPFALMVRGPIHHRIEWGHHATTGIERGTVRWDLLCVSSHISVTLGY